MLAAIDCTDLDDGPRIAKSGTDRMCAVTRQVRPISELLRFVVTPEGAVVADLKRKLPGRGLWITAAQSVLTEAVRRGVFARGFKRDLRVSPNLVGETDALLVRGVVDALSMAGKAGEVVTGFGKVETALRGGHATALIHACEAAPDGIRKLDAILRQIGGKISQIPVLVLLKSDQLDLALGRTNVIHAALLAGPAATTVLARCRGIDRFREYQGRRDAAETSETGRPASESSVVEASVVETSVVQTSITEASVTEASSDQGIDKESFDKGTF